MAAKATRRFIQGAIEGADLLHVAMPWERGARRRRMALRRALKLVRRSA